MTSKNIKLSHSLDQFNQKIKALSKLSDEIESKINSGNYDNKTKESLEDFEFFLGMTSNFLSAMHKSYKKEIGEHIKGGSTSTTKTIIDICKNFFFNQKKL